MEVGDNMRLIIGLIGAKRAGKDTVGQIALERFGASGTISFARCFKDEIMKEIFKFTAEQIDGDEKDSFLSKNVPLSTKTVRQIIHKVADLYNRLKNKNVINPYSISVSSWDRHVFVGGKNTYRDVIKFVATEIIRHICPTWHIEMAFKNVQPQGVYLVTDMRFENEYEHCKKTFGDEFYLVYVKNEVAEEKGKDNHPSEQGYLVLRDKADAVVDSVYGELEQLEKDSAKVFKKIQRKVLKKGDEESTT